MEIAICKKRIVMTRIFQICQAYESGFGHGFKLDGLDLIKTPHSDPEMGEAYQIGYDAGVDASVEKQDVKREILESAIDAVRSCERLPGPRVRLYEAIGAIDALKKGGQNAELRM